MSQPRRLLVISVVGVVLSLYTLAEVNYPVLLPQSELALFALLGLVVGFLHFPLHPRWADNRHARRLDYLLVALTIFCFGYVIVQTQPFFEGLWLQGQALGERAGRGGVLDYVVGILGIVIVLEAARRTIGLSLPILALLFLLYALWGQEMPSWLFPHRGYSIERTVSQTFLQSQGIFGVALRVMFTYVFLFIIFGAFLKVTGATQFIIDFTRRIFGGTPGGPAKIAVVGSGLMGSLSGSAVANTATTGTFTIPLMRASRYRPDIAGGIEAAASTGGAMVPPVMGAAAYMMLEIIHPPVTYLEIIRAAILPALLYYLSLLLIVHSYSKRLAQNESNEPSDSPSLTAVEGPVFPFSGFVFVSGFLGLILFLLMGYTPFRAVSLCLPVVIVLASLKPETRINWTRLSDALIQSAKDVIPLICAAACVGIIVGVVTLTGIGTRFPSAILPLAEGSLLLALLLIMVSTIILGMGLPPAVCYLLMAILIGPVLNDLGVVPMAAHLFILYFGMMAMVTPPVALAAYAASSISGARMMPTAIAAFRFALVGFLLPFMFVYRPELLMLSSDGQLAPATAIVYTTVVALLGIIAFAAMISGYLFSPLSKWVRALLGVTAALLLFPGQSFLVGGFPIPVHDAMGALLLLLVGLRNWKGRQGEVAALGRGPVSPG